jgi:hypothetical protein
LTLWNKAEISFSQQENTPFFPGRLVFNTVSNTDYVIPAPLVQYHKRMYDLNIRNSLSISGEFAQQYEQKHQVILQYIQLSMCQYIKSKCEKEIMFRKIKKIIYKNFF